MVDKVNVIVVTRDNLECISQTTSAIYQHTKYPYELLVIDNHSVESEVIQYLNAIEARDDTRVIHLPENIFYYPAVNVGLRTIDLGNRYTLVLNDDIVIESDQWIQYMITVLESEKGIAYVGDFRENGLWPPWGGYIDGWCMFLRTESMEKIGFFDEEYIWWYGAADYAIRAFKKGLKIKDFKRPGDQVNHVSGIIRHIGHRTIEKVKNDATLPREAMFRPDFRIENLLLKHGLYRYYLSLVIKKRLSPFWAIFDDIGS